MELRDPLTLPRAEPRARSRLFAACSATAVAILVLTELIVLDAALAWGAIGLWGLPVEGAIALGGAGALASCWAVLLMFRSTYAAERASGDHDLSGAGSSTLTDPVAGVTLNCGSVARASVADGTQSQRTLAVEPSAGP